MFIINIKTRVNHIFFQNKTSSRTPTKAAKRSEFCRFSSSVFFIRGRHLKAFFKEANIEIEYFYKFYVFQKPLCSEIRMILCFCQFIVYFLTITDS